MLIMFISLLKKSMALMNCDQQTSIFNSPRIGPLHILPKVHLTSKFEISSHARPKHTYLAVFITEMAIRRHIFYSFWKSKRQFATWILLPEKYIRNSITRCIAKVPSMHDRRYQSDPRHGYSRTLCGIHKSSEIMSSFHVTT
jgi:hypothetical protein